MSSVRQLLVSGLLVAAALAAAPAGAQERASPPRPGGGSGLPSGSYLNSCRGANLNGNMLSAQCPGPTGAPIFSSIDTNSCRGRDIANDRGYLRCNGNGPRPPIPPRPQPPRPQPPFPPPGQGVQAIAYTQPNFRGRELPVRGPISNLADYRGFNDTIRSIRIMRGRPEVCTDARFRGRCVTLRRSEANLAAIGMANQISSIR